MFVHHGVSRGTVLLFSLILMSMSDFIDLLHKGDRPCNIG